VDRRSISDRLNVASNELICQRYHGCIISCFAFHHRQRSDFRRRDIDFKKVGQENDVMMIFDFEI